jgi:two-component system, cell cycle sensor histidine kinase and response regulator CckA
VAATTSPPDPLMTAGPTVLVVDDHPAARSVLAAMLRRQGCQVLLASDGEEALEVYRRYHPDIDLVILDLWMPRMGGAATLDALRRVNPQVRCGVISGLTTGDDREAESLRRRGAEAVLAKPYRFDQLADLVHRLRRAPTG